MTHHKHYMLVSGAVLGTALFLLSGCRDTSTVAQAGSSTDGRSTRMSSHSVSSGTRIQVALSSNISSKTAQVGVVRDAATTETVSMQNDGTIPSGSPVN